MHINVSQLLSLQTLKGLKEVEDAEAAASGEPEDPNILRRWEQRYYLANFIDGSLFRHFYDTTGQQKHFVYYDEARDQMVIVKRLEDNSHDEIERLRVRGEDDLPMVMSYFNKRIGRLIM